MDTKALALAEKDYIIGERRRFHAHPELGTEEYETTKHIAEELRRMGIDVRTFDDITGCVGTLRGGRPGKTVMLRADIDALSMPDESGTPWAAKVCRNHACGHDGHAAWLMLTLRYLAAHRDFPGRIVAIFQPAEEIGRGALAVVASGIFEKYGIAEVYGAHNDSMLPAGEFSFGTFSGVLRLLLHSPHRPRHSCGAPAHGH